jgi:hypothetical protein
MYELERGTKFKLIEGEVRVPPAAQCPTDSDEVYRYSHVDGMYCTCYDSKDNKFYMAAWTEVEIQ